MSVPAGMTLDGVYEWTYRQLEPDTVIQSRFPAGIHRGTIAQQVKGAALVMQFYTGSVLSVINGITMYEDLTLTIKAIGRKADWNTMVEGMHRAHSLLHRASGTGAGDVGILFCEYKMPVQYPETELGIDFENYGARFQYLAQAQ